MGRRTGDETVYRQRAFFEDTDTTLEMQVEA